MTGRELLTLTAEQCWHDLALHDRGRLAFDAGDGIDVLPVNYRAIEHRGKRLLIVRTRQGSPVTHLRGPAAIQVDGTDDRQRTGWSLLARGSMRRLTDAEVSTLGADADPGSWLGAEASEWWGMEPTSLTGRELVLDFDVWSPGDGSAPPG